MTNQFGDTVDASSRITELLDSFGTEKVVKPAEKKMRYNLEFDEDTHWRLVRLGALKKMHQEDFLEELITSVMEALATDEEEESDIVFPGETL